MLFIFRPTFVLLSLQSLQRTCALLLRRGTCARSTASNVPKWKTSVSATRGTYVQVDQLQLIIWATLTQTTYKIFDAGRGWNALISSFCHPCFGVRLSKPQACVPSLKDGVFYLGWLKQKTPLEAGCGFGVLRPMLKLRPPFLM